MSNEKTRAKKKNNMRKRDGFRLFLLTTPILIGVFIFSYVPLAGWTYAFFDYKPGIPLEESTFVGFKYFTMLFQNPVQRADMLRVLKNTLGMSFLNLAAMILPLFFAVFLAEIRATRYRKIVQTLTTIPNFISWVLVYAAFYAIFSTDGFINSVFGTSTNFLASSEHVWMQMWGYHIWKSLGWNAIMYISAITSIDAEMYEAAEIDGAGRFAKMFYITIPFLIPTFFVLFVLQIGNLLNNGMDQYYVFENAMNKESIEVLDLYVYNTGLKNNNIPYATAIGMLKSVISVILVFSANFASKKVRGTAIF